MMQREIPSFQQFRGFFHAKLQLSLTWNDSDTNPNNKDYTVEMQIDSSEQYC